MKKVFLISVRGFFYYLFYKLRYYPKVLFSHLRNKPVVINICAGTMTYPIEVYPPEGGLAEDLYINHVREYPNVEYFINFIHAYANTIDTYIGSGANIGYYEILSHRLLSKYAKHKIRTFFIEPVGVTFHRLLANLRLNDINVTNAQQVAVGDRNDTVSMLVPKQKNISRIVSDVLPQTKEPIQEVKMVTIDRFFRLNKIQRKNIIFRWDIEGYEYNLVKGNLHFFKTLRNAHIIMEFHPFFLGPEKSIEFLNMLASGGFKLIQVISCEPLYFLRMPGLIRKLLRWSFLSQYKGDALGLIKRYKTFKNLKKDLRRPDHALYHYPNLHLYISKQ